MPNSKITDEWKPTGKVPDTDDVVACCKSSDEFFKDDTNSIDELMRSMNEGEKEVFLFRCGFYRGQNWGEFKTCFNIGKAIGGVLKRSGVINIIDSGS